jgi:uncharacterized protein YndB with AHSA1/START domain
MPNIHQAVLVSAPIETVYRAIASQEGLSGWWTPDVKAAAQVNTVARFRFGPDYFKDMKIVELEPNSRVKWVCMQGADEWIGTTLSFKLEAGDSGTLSSIHPELKDQVQQASKGKQTLLVLHHDNWQEYSLMFAECSYTWGQFLRSLKLLCETGTGEPWPNQHRLQTRSDHRAAASQRTESVRVN